jgi:hypothetical protein
MNMQRIVHGIALGTAIAAGVCLMAPSAMAQDKRQGHPDLTGEWSRNVELSTSPRDGREGAGGRPDGGRRGRNGGGGGGFGGGGFGGGRRGGFSGGGGRGSAEDMEKLREQLQQARALFDDVPASMVVTYTDPKLSIASADGRTRTLYTDKRKQKTSNGNAEVQSRWDGTDVVAETKFGSLKVIETFALSPEGQLVVTVKMDGSGGGRGGGRDPGVRHVYDRVVGPGAIPR